MFEGRSFTENEYRSQSGKNIRCIRSAACVLSIILAVVFASENIEAGDLPSAIQSELLRITSADLQTKEISVTVSEPPANSGGLLLTFHAWLDFETFGGYRRAFKVFWDGVELTKTENLPDTFSMRDGRMHQSYVSEDGWTVPYALDFEQASKDVENPYYPADEDFKPGLFVFAPDGVSPGTHTITIERTADVEQDLVLDDIRVEWEK